MEFRVEVTSAEAAARMRAIAAALPAASASATVQAGHVAQLAIMRQLTQSSHPRGTPTPSAPGEPPSLVSGMLRRSMRVSDPIPTPGAVMVTVGPTVIYGRIHELGGDTGRGYATHLPKRPYVEPGVKASLEEVASVYRVAWGRVISGA